MITPILLRSFGRSGSTLLMQLLGTSKNVLFEREYPFENRYLTYIYRSAKLPFADFKEFNGWESGQLMDEHHRQFGPIPYEDMKIFDQRKIAQFSSKLIQSSWEIYAEMMDVSETDSSQNIYYAEKVALDIAKDINDNLFTKNIILFRDPRDEFVSIQKFNEKRGSLDFGAAQYDSEEDFARGLCSERKPFMNWFASVDNEERRFKILYEELMQNPYETTEKIGNWLGVALNYDLVKAKQSNFSHHITSADVNQSCQRWKTEMPKNIQSIFEQELGEELVILGYEV